MNSTKDKRKEPAPERVVILQSLSPEVLKTLTKEEIRAILFEDEWPNSLKKKLSSYLE